ncbi:MAG: sulfite exporter TauE/SafE family protein [Betaproteobacteria bacterium]|nr:sulfite exporter TauE/SafE family protein [Betaproteobacteria bacterium]
MESLHALAAGASSYWLAFITGLLGSGHCLGMCGGLASGFFMKMGTRAPAPYLAYHAARIGVYAAIGIVAATLGAVVLASGRIGLGQGVLQIVAGGVVILPGVSTLWSGVRFYLVMYRLVA